MIVLTGIRRFLRDPVDWILTRLLGPAEGIDDYISRTTNPHPIPKEDEEA